MVKYHLYKKTFSIKFLNMELDLVNEPLLFPVSSFILVCIWLDIL